MLGARARAAEYNAAKAATARQQATRVSEEQRLPPRPAPISLSAFTRHASYTRNRGVKSFVPLILSEEEEKKSTSSTGVASEQDQVNSPQADLVLRPASLPPPQTTISNSVDIELTAHTPMRYISPQSQVQQYTTTPRSLHNEDEYGFPMTTMSFPPHFVPYQQTRSFVSHPNVLPSPHVGWHTPPIYHGTHCSYPDTGVVPTPSFTEPRPQLHHNLSRESTAISDSITESPLKTSPLKKHPATTTVKLGGPTLYVFGPDDLSPFKMEIKQRAREEYFANKPAHQSTPKLARTDTGSVGIFRSPEPSLSNPLIQSAQAQKQKLMSSLQRADMQDLLIDHDSVAPVSMRRCSASIGLFSKLSEPAKLRSFDLCGNTDDIWSNKDTASLYRQITASDGSPIRHSRNDRYDTADNDLGKNSYTLGRPRQGTKITEKSEPGVPLVDFHDPPSEMFDIDPERQRREQEQKFVIERLLTYPSDPEWWEVHGSSAEDRERIMILRRTMSATLDLTGEHTGVSAIKHEEIRIQYQQSRGEYERRHKRVKELANEMQHKWEYGGQFRGPAMTKDEAIEYAGTVKEIGHMMTMLGMLADSSHCGLGSRPYVQPPEYAIERGIGMETEVATSLFEQEGDGVRTAPPRLARDPRFRGQMNEGMKIRAEEGKIPRMFVPRPRLQS